MPADSFRLFFALWPDAAARAALAQLAVAVAAVGGGRMPRDAALHVTLAFLGSVPAARVDAVERAGEQAAAAGVPFDLVLDRVGGTRHGIAWLAPSAVPAPLERLHDALVQSLAAEGFPPEARRFRPHVTLARDCRRAVARRPAAPIGWHVDRVALVASRLAPGGSTYTERAAWPLAGGGA